MINFAIKCSKYLLFAGVFFLFTSVNGQVVINEFSCSNYSLNIGGDNEDYIEFYNPAAVAEDIGGFFLSDNPLNTDKFEIPAGTFFPAGGYLLVMCSGEGELITNLYLGGISIQILKSINVQVNPLYSVIHQNRSLNNMIS